MQPILGSVSSGAIALALVLGLILLAARLLRRSGLAALAGVQARPGRLAVMDTLALDRSRRLLLVRCDGKDLLLLTGATSESAVGWLGDAADSRQVEG